MHLETPRTVVVLDVEHSRVDLLQIRDTEVSSIHSNLLLDDVDGVKNTSLAINVGVHERSANTHSLDTESKHLQDVRPVADTSICEDLQLLKDPWSVLIDLKGNFESYNVDGWSV